MRAYANQHAQSHSTRKVTSHKQRCPPIALTYHKGRYLLLKDALFSQNALGTPGSARRRFFSGPGMNNFDMALLKTVGLTESKSLQFRLEGFNIFNHAQFFGPQAVNGNISSFTFGQVVSAAPPRLVQLGAKFLF